MSNSKHNNGGMTIDGNVLDEEVVILLQGKNSFDDPIYSYLKLTLHSLRKLKVAMSDTEHFLPSDFGDVIAAGKGIPSQELRDEMATNYNMKDLIKPKPKPAVNFDNPNLWND